jgi:hypothetical protein
MRGENIAFDKLKLYGNLREVGITISEFNKSNDDVRIGGKERYDICLEFWNFYLRIILLLRALV